MVNMKLSDLKDKKIGIFGFGQEGQALFKYLTRHSIGRITVFDETDLPAEKRFLVESGKADLICGKFEKPKCADIDVAFRSPGLKRDKIQALLRPDAVLSSLINLFCGEHKGRIVAVTGTKGKSTTVGLISEILKQNSVKYFVGGNIGNPPIEFLDETTEDSISVLELSSFQLEDFDGKSDVAIILPIFPDHLDYHQNQGETFNFHNSEAEYFIAKSQIIKNMDHNSLIIAFDREDIRRMINASAAKKILFGRSGVGAGCFLKGVDVICEDLAKSATFKDIQILCHNNKVPITNALAAITFAFSQNLNIESSVFENFKKLPFRIELVGEVKNIKYYNDSAATNPISTIAAMETMTEPYALIMGGSSKGLSFDEFANIAKKQEHLKKVFLFGQTANEIQASLIKADFASPVIKMQNLANIISAVKEDNSGSKSVLFSPASASFDQFANYKQRGEHFNGLVLENN
jgi:UDP-N-acetylmuramoylalanine--D-glutamate ligase